MEGQNRVGKKRSKRDTGGGVEKKGWGCRKKGLGVRKNVAAGRLRMQGSAKKEGVNKKN